MSALCNGSVSCVDSSSAAVKDAGLYGWSESEKWSWKV